MDNIQKQDQARSERMHTCLRSIAGDIDHYIEATPAAPLLLRDFRKRIARALYGGISEEEKDSIRLPRRVVEALLRRRRLINDQDRTWYGLCCVDGD